SSAAAKKIAEQQQSDAQKAKLQLAFQEVEKVTTDFSASDKWQALAVCHNFLLEYTPAKNSDEYYEATWCKGAAFDALGVHNKGAAILLEVLLLGADKPRFNEALEAFINSADEAGYYPASL